MVRLTGHCTLVSGDLVGLDDEPVGGDLHTFVDVDDVADQDEILVHVEDFSVSANSHNFPRFSLLVEFLELSLLLVVVHGRHSRRDHHCEHNREPFDPGDLAFLVVSSPHLNRNRNNTGDNQNPQSKVFQSSAE